MRLAPNGTETVLGPGNPVRSAADYPVGFHTLDLGTVWLQGDVSYRVRLDVRAATPRGPVRTSP